MLEQQSRLFVEVPCSGGTASGSFGGPVLHHLENCMVKVEGSRTTVGSFEWPGKFTTLCGVKEATGVNSLPAGMRLSFLGNTSDGILNPFDVENDALSVSKVRICDFKEGAVTGREMIEQEKPSFGKVFQGLLYFFAAVIWASACLFFPDSQREDRRVSPSQPLRICGVGMLAVCVSVTWALLIFYLGGIGWYIALGLVLVLLVLGCSDSFFETCRQVFERMSTTNIAADEEAPLLPPGSGANAQESHSDPVESEPEPPLRTETLQEIRRQRETARPGQGQPVSSDEDKEGSSGQVLIAVAVGIITGTIVGIILSICLSYVLE